MEGWAARRRTSLPTNLARMNMLLHRVKDTELGIFHGDTLIRMRAPYAPYAPGISSPK